MPMFVLSAALLLFDLGLWYSFSLIGLRNSEM